MLSNCGPLSTTIARGIPNQQTMFFHTNLETLQEKSLSLTFFHHQGKVYLSGYVTIYICHLCQCQEKFKSTLTFTYVKVVSISTNDRIFVSMTYVNFLSLLSRLDSTYVKIS